MNKKKKEKKKDQGSNPGGNSKVVTESKPEKPENPYENIPGREDDYENLSDYGQEYEEGDGEEGEGIPPITEFGRISVALMPLFHEHSKRLDEKSKRALLGPYGLTVFLVAHDDLFEEKTYHELLARLGFLMSALGKVTGYVNEYDAMRHSVSVQAKGIEMPHSAQNISLTVAPPTAQPVARSGGLVGAFKRVLFGKPVEEGQGQGPAPNPQQVTEGTVPTTSLMVTAMQITPMLNHAIQLLMQKRVLTSKLYSGAGKGLALRLNESATIKGILLNAVRMLGDNATAARDYGQGKVLEGVTEIVGKEVSTVTQPITQVFTQPVDTSGGGWSFPTREQIKAAAVARARQKERKDEQR